MSQRVWVDETRTLLAALWDDGTLEVATRDTPAHTWGPPRYLRLEVFACRDPEGDWIADQEKGA